MAVVDQETCNHNVVVYCAEDPKKFRKGTTQVLMICDKCAKKFGPFFYDPSEKGQSKDATQIREGTTMIDELLKSQHLKIDFDA